MKKVLLTLVLAFVMVFCACEEKTNQELNVVAPDGAPAVSIVRLMAEGNIDGNPTTYSIVSGADSVTTSVANRTADIAVMPLNLAAKLYNKGTNIKLVSVSVFGVLYLVGKAETPTLNDLKGKTVYNIGRGGTPDLTFKYILAQNGIEYVEDSEPVEGKVALKYVSASSELIPLLKTGAADYGIMGEPAVTQVNAKAGTTTLFSIQDEWKKITGFDYVQAGVVVGSTVYNNQRLMEKLTAKLATNADWALGNASKIKANIQAKGSSLELDFTKDLVTKCNIGYSSALTARSDIEAYLSVIMSFQEAAVGGKLPDDGFYYDPSVFDSTTAIESNSLPVSAE